MEDERKASIRVGSNREDDDAENSVEDAIAEESQQAGGKAGMVKKSNFNNRAADEESLAGMTSISTIRTVHMGQKQVTYK